MNRTFEVYRYDAVTGREPRFQEYELKVEPTDRILECLNRIRWELDPTLGFRMSCAHGVCGSDGMRINGVCTIACQRKVQEFPEGAIRIEPLPNFPIRKDLIVDLDGFFDTYRAVKPYLIAGESHEDRERLQDPGDRKVYDEAIRCILCASCTASCPITGDNPNYLGPAALLRAFRYLMDSRDSADEARMDLLDSLDGIWGCKGHGRCTEVCPKEIDVKKRLAQTKKRLHDGGRTVKN